MYLWWLDMTSVEVKVLICDKVQCSCKQFRHVDHSCSLKFSKNCKQQGLSPLIVPHIPQNQNNLMCRHLMPLPAQQLAFTPIMHLMVVLYSLIWFNKWYFQPFPFSLGHAIQGKSSNVSHPWFLDSGASNHMTNSSEYLHNTHSYYGTLKIQIIDGNTLPITIVDAINSDFQNVFVSTKLASNLLHVGKLVDKQL